MPWVYILRCADGSYYVGSTTHLEYRLWQHQQGEGAEYTKHRRPVELAFAHETETVGEAFGLEKRIQGWGRAKREALIRGDFDALPGLASRRRPRGDGPSR
ncbi:GIY-YIG nuclease family protein [Protaetiibacter mangrovi]|uniref:GIY-YIG nuclease family protein n=1 Tax=Protaetiibacter mangrovi TaxID=2970926 RepID=A0ABT1ZI71_9MICO|nr:GIY-YIG nuclease family protein [Protaetiibacter mangrovi]MCS0500403.1 GIY-YIG nuclease family protein [Protaetiibacter mangrovi]TPX03334.1 GIY-YIG nuclease family protein [Schumannella luteola]